MLSAAGSKAASVYLLPLLQGRYASLPVHEWNAK